MANKELNQELATTVLIGRLAESWEKVAVLRMKRTRATVLRSRRFMDRLGAVFAHLKAGREKTISKKNKPVERENNRRLAVIISTDNRWHGGLTARLMKEFRRREKDYQLALVVGRRGWEFYRRLKIRTPGRYLGEKNWSAADWRKLEEQLSEFGRVDVYHSRLESFVRQTPAMVSLSGDWGGAWRKEEKEGGAESGEEKKGEDYLFEPTLAELWRFFRRSAAGGIFRQAQADSRLAYLAARVKTMEETLGRVERRRRRLEKGRRRLRRREDDLHQQARLAGVFSLRGGSGV